MVRMGRRRMPRYEKRKGMKEDVLSRLREFIENEVRSGAMNLGCIIPLYVYRMLVGAVSMKEISTAMDEIKKNQ